MEARSTFNLQLSTTDPSSVAILRRVDDTDKHGWTPISGRARAPARGPTRLSLTAEAQRRRERHRIFQPRMGTDERGFLLPSLNNQPPVRHSSQSEGGSTFSYYPPRMGEDSHYGLLTTFNFFARLPVEHRLPRVSRSGDDFNRRGAEAPSLPPSLGLWTLDFGLLSDKPSCRCWSFVYSRLSQDDPGGNSPAGNRRNAHRVWLDHSGLQGAESICWTRSCRA